MLKKRVVLIGGGHTHAMVLRKWAMQAIPNAELLLISPVENAAYSGMLPGYVAGQYHASSIHIDLRQLTHAAGAAFVTASVEGIDPTNRTIQMATRPPLAFDVASINIGSIPSQESVPGATEYAIPVKPVSGFIHSWEQILEQSSSRDRPLRVVLVGGGAGGVELALAMAHRLGDTAQLSIVHNRSTLLANHNSCVQKLITRELLRKGITLLLSDQAIKVSSGLLHLSSGRTLAFDALYWTTNAVAPRWFKDTGLELTNTDFLALDNTLSCRGYPGLFAAGDCATVVGQERPKSGVFAIRQAPTLYTNIAHTLSGKPLVAVKLQRKNLALIATGDKRAIASWGPLTASGAWVWRWKDSIDRKFMKGFDTIRASSTIQVANGEV